jgi:hypothetical protein
MSDSEVIVVSLAIGFSIGLAVLMVLWACRACLCKPKTSDDDHVATNATRRQPTVPGAAEVAAQDVHIQLPARPEQARHFARSNLTLDVLVLKARASVYAVTRDIIDPHA